MIVMRKANCGSVASAPHYKDQHASNLALRRAFTPEGDMMPSALPIPRRRSGPQPSRCNSALQRLIDWLAEMLKADVSRAHALARSLNNLLNRLSDSGNRAGALRAIEDAVEMIYSRLAQAQPAAFEPDRAVSLYNLSRRLSDNAGGASEERPAGPPRTFDRERPP
jgi:hypothetical protein